MPVLTGKTRISSVQLIGLETINLPVVPDNDIGYTVGAHAKAKYIIKEISGLEPPDVNVAIAHTSSGGKYQGRTYGDRALVFLISLNPNLAAGETHKFLRDQLQTMLSTGYDPKVIIQLVAGFPLCKVAAYVTKFEEALFDKDPVVQITFTTLNPTFAGIYPSKYSPSELDTKHPNVYNYGTAETGFQFKVKFTDTKEGWFLKQVENQDIGMEFDMTFHDGDILAVSTIPGSRYIHWNKRRGTVKNKLGILTGDSEWITLHPGSNRFVTPPRTKWDWKGNLQFTAQYWGA